jgi:hypothetical protein
MGLFDTLAADYEKLAADVTNPDWKAAVKDGLTDLATTVQDVADAVSGGTCPCPDTPPATPQAHAFASGPADRNALAQEAKQHAATLRNAGKAKAGPGADPTALNVNWPQLIALLMKLLALFAPVAPVPSPTPSNPNIGQG